MLGQLFSSVVVRSPELRRNGWQRVYEFLATTYAHADRWTFMNYGYEPVDSAARPLLEETDEADRYFIQLYHLYAYVYVQRFNIDALQLKYCILLYSSSQHSRLKAQYKIDR